MLSDKITSFFIFKEDKVAINEKKHIGYIKIFIHHYKNLFYIPCADPEGRFRGPDPPLEFWQKCCYRIHEWGQVDIAQHLC